MELWGDAVRDACGETVEAPPPTSHHQTQDMPCTHTKLSFSPKCKCSKKVNNQWCPFGPPSRRILKCPPCPSPKFSASFPSHLAATFRHMHKGVTTAMEQNALEEDNQLHLAVDYPTDRLSDDCISLLQGLFEPNHKMVTPRCVLRFFGLPCHAFFYANVPTAFRGEGCMGNQGAPFF